MFEGALQNLTGLAGHVAGEVGVVGRSEIAAKVAKGKWAGQWGFNRKSSRNLLPDYK